MMQNFASCSAEQCVRAERKRLQEVPRRSAVRGRCVPFRERYIVESNRFFLSIPEIDQSGPWSIEENWQGNKKLHFIQNATDTVVGETRLSLVERAMMRSTLFPITHLFKKFCMQYYSTVYCTVLYTVYWYYRLLCTGLPNLFGKVLDVTASGRRIWRSGKKSTTAIVVYCLK